MRQIFAHLGTGLRLWIASPVPLLLLSVALNVALATRVLTLTNAIAVLKTEGQLQAGAVVPPLEGTRIGNQPITYRFDTSTLPTLVYVMRPTCVWCLRNNENIKAVIENATGRYRVVVASLTAEGTADYLRQHDIEAEAITNLSEQTKRAYHLGGTPQTILVSPSGMVVKSWMGAYSGDMLAEIERTLAVRLPGVAEAPAKTSGN